MEQSLRYDQVQVRHPTFTSSDVDFMPPSDISAINSTSPLGIGRFDYNNPVATIRRGAATTPSSRSGSTGNIEHSTKAPRAKRSTTVTAFHFSDVPESNFAKLLGCVCCQLSWTTRKSTAQKIKHIQTCGKKNKLTDDVIGILIQKELEKALPSSNKGKKVLPSDGPQEPAPRTLLEEVTNGAARKKSGPRLQVVETIKTVADTRGDIHARAKTLLNGSTARQVEPHSTHGLRDIEEQDENSQLASPPQTQSFGESALARKFQSGPARQEPLPTQAYIPTQFARPSDSRNASLAHAETSYNAVSFSSSMSKQWGY